MGCSCLKDLNYSKVFRNEFLKAKSGVRAAVCVIFFWLVGGESNWVMSLESHLPQCISLGVCGQHVVTTFQVGAGRSGSVLLSV